MAAGYETATPRAEKLWRVSRILGERSPFDPYILGHNEAQIDFVLEMYAKENKGVKFVRPGKTDDSENEVLTSRSWANRLMGPALARFMEKKMPSKDVLAILRRVGGKRG